MENKWFVGAFNAYLTWPIIDCIGVAGLVVSLRACFSIERLTMRCDPENIVKASLDLTSLGPQVSVVKITFLIIAQ